MISVEDIKRLIDYDNQSEKKKRARVGQRYYNAEHDIMRYRMFYYNADGKLVEDTTRSNIKISHPFFTELSDQLAAYVLSFKDNPIRAVETAEGLQDQLDEYFDDDFWTEISEVLTGAYTKGFDYIYAYKNEDDRLAFQHADSIGVVEVRERDTDENCEYMIYWYTERVGHEQKEIKRIQVWSDKDTTYYIQEDSGEIKLDSNVQLNPRPHVVFTEKSGTKKGYAFGYIPFWRLDLNKKQVSGLKPIKGLIDDYDLHACSLSNNLKDFDTPLHVVRGFEGDNLDELQTNLKTKKIIGTDEEGGVEIRTVDIPYQARKEKLDLDEKNIYRFGMGLNMIGLKDTSATTNIAIKAAYSLLDLKANKLERRLKRLLKELLKVVLEEINSTNGTGYQIKDVYFDFVREVMTNETENMQNEKTRAEMQQVQINTLLDLAATLDEETVVREICTVLDIDYDAIKDKLPEQAEMQIQGAESTLKGIEPEGDPVAFEGSE